MLDLQDHQFEILPSEDDSNGVGFGLGLDVSLDQEGFKPGALSWATQDTKSPRGSVAFGRDVLTGPVWGWDLFVDQDDEATALDALARIATAWRADAIRETPGAVLPVRYRINGRDRRVYGRPRNFDAPPNNLILNGFIPITTDFQAVDAYTYDDSESSAEVNLGAVTFGGFQFPVTFPASTQGVGSQNASITVLGDAATYPVIRFEGPISNPVLSTDDWTLKLNMNLAATDYVVVDTRPWALSAMLNGSQSVAGKLGRRQWLSDIRLKPGITAIRFDGDSSSGGARATVSWRSAYNSI